ncbi:GNAT family N-acetyltransferase [Haploplasma axanthum]|uniref:Spermine/spermidine acetyltransferase n=1 Tax=Haploplasma axanthum TaxID=29552 RepID=A0A449BDD2_HAPAX|nr:GNAT family N-acetyltransferase [Haploplasma axanthum]VEU80459.1 Spermine/spermidine acetyltransferase [Haploplasma axanthum]
MIEIKEITEDNYERVIKLEVNDDQKKYVAPNVKSLADCYVYRNNNDVFPFAIYNDEEIIGFIMFYTEDEEKEITIWRIMIDKEYQGMGYGKRALEIALEYINDKTIYEKVYIDYVVGNEIAMRLYERLGFKFDKTNEYNEVVMKYIIER